jgi:hypothetical protein
VVSSARISVEADNTSTNSIEGSDLSTDGNRIRAMSQSNSVLNVLAANGTTVANDASNDPAAALSGQGNIVLEQTSFALASRQESSVDVSSAVLGAVIGVDAGVALGDPLTGSITGSNLTADTNVIAAETRGNSAVNAAVTDFVQNAGQATVANSQIAGDDPEGLGVTPLTYDAQVTGVAIGVITSVDGAVADSAFSASNNGIFATSIANGATSSLDARGTNVVMRNGDNLTEVDPAAGSLTSDASLAVLNMQGVADLSAPPVNVQAGIEGAAITVGADGLFDSGSVATDGNGIIATAIEHDGLNTLAITASANIDAQGVDDETPGASVASIQTISEGSSVTASTSGALIAAIVDDPRSDLSFAASASGNEISANALGGTAVNWLQATAGAEINNPQASSPLVGDGATTTHALDAGFNVLNVQQGAASTFAASVSLAGIAAGGAEDYLNDSVVVDGNLVIAGAQGFGSNNILALDAGSSSDATGAVMNVQSLEDSGVTANVETVAIATGNLDEGAEFTSLSVSGNVVDALAGGNSAFNGLSTSADASLQESSGTGAIVDPSAVNPISVTGADYAVLNSQAVTNGTISASVGTVGIGIDGLEATTGVNNSALNVDGNEVVAAASGSDAINSLALSTGTFAHPSSSVANLQVATGTSIGATVDGVAVGIGGVGTTIGATSTNSSFSVRGNVIGASSMGNSAINSLTSGN